MITSKKRITSDGYMPVKSGFTFPELIEADKYMSSAEGRKRRPRYYQPGSAEEAFGKKNLENKAFIKQLRRLDEKHKVIGLA